MRRAFKIKRHGNLIVSKKKGGAATPTSTPTPATSVHDNEWFTIALGR